MSSKTCNEWKDVKGKHGGIVRRCARFSEGQDTAMHKGGLGSFPAVFKGSVDVPQLGLGAAIGLFTTLGVRWAANKYLTGKLPDVAIRFLPALTGFGTAAALYYAQGGSPKAKAHAVGAAAVGVLVQGYDVIRAKLPQLGDYSAYSSYLQVNMPGVNGMGLYAPAQPQLPAMNGLGVYVNEGSPERNSLALSAMPDGEDDPYSAWGA